MNNKIFMGGLSYSTTENIIAEKLSLLGVVKSVRIVVDYETGKSKGYAFVTMETEEQASEVIKKYNNEMFDGRRIGVKESNR